MHAEFQKQRTEKKRIKIKSRVEKKKGRGLERKEGFCFSVREPGQSLVQRQVPFRLDKVNKTT